MNIIINFVTNDGGRLIKGHSKMIGANGQDP